MRKIAFETFRTLTSLEKLTQYRLRISVVAVWLHEAPVHVSKLRQLLFLLFS
ncbi:hypothetical protein HanIR_Chr10g0456751 [Helianthus annuus]|nr:hypothetical protein HanIR_Chr10g0456751 [Helianthus annuus]